MNPTPTEQPFYCIECGTSPCQHPVTVLITDEAEIQKWKALSALLAVLLAVALVFAIALAV